MEPTQSSINNYYSPQDQKAFERLTILAAIIESSDDAIISKSLQGIITSWNAAATKIFGYTEAEIVGESIIRLIPAELEHEENYILSRIANGNKVDHFQTTRVTKSGRKVQVSITVSPIRDINGKVVGASKIARDITAQKESEARQALLAAIIDSSGDAIISKNLKGYITSWNIGAERIFGYTRQEMMGKHITTLIPTAHRPEEDYIMGCIVKGEKVDHFQTIRIGKTGNKIPVSITVSPIINEEGIIIGASKIARDINQQVTQTQRLEELNRAKDEFIGIASHELKTPLTSIKAYVQVLERKLTNDPNHQFVNRVLQQVNKLIVLIGDLLDVSKIQAGRMQFDPKEFDMNLLILECIESVSHSTTHHIHYKPSEKPVLVVADQQRIEQVLVNLISNAIKYSPKSDRVNITCHQDADKVEVHIQDFGIGIQASDLEKIFSRFYRAEGLEPSFSGLGIGLYISHEIIQRHSGSLTVQSEPGKGSVFLFSIPCQPEN